MKPNSPELRALLATRQFFRADLYTITPVGGSPLYYCSGDQDVVANGITYPAGGQVGPYFDRADNKARITQSTGVNVDNLVVDIIPGSSTVAGAPFLQAIRNGFFDAADVTLERAYMPTYGDTRRGLIRMFAGRVGDIDCGRSVATFSINSHMELFNLQFPRNLVQVSCVNNLGDSTCQVNINSFASTGAIAATSTPGQLLATIAPVSGVTGSNYNYGKVVFTSGVLNGFQAGIRTCVLGSPSTINLSTILPGPPGIGDTFNIYQGCDKSSGFPVMISASFATQVDPSTLSIRQGNMNLLQVGATINGPDIVVPTTVVALIPGGAWGLGNIAISPPLNSTTDDTMGQGVTFMVTNPPSTQNGCAKFNNQVRFRGMPFVPQPATAV